MEKFMNPAGAKTGRRLPAGNVLPLSSLLGSFPGVLTPTIQQNNHFALFPCAMGRKRI